MRFLFLLILLFFIHCSLFQVQKDKEMYYSDCMKVFQEPTKCKELADKYVTESEPIPLTQEQYKNLKDRKVMKNTLQDRNKLFVKNYLGEPDSEVRDANSEFFIYKRPISIESGSVKPDKEVKIRFIRDKVSKVYATDPDM